VIKTCQQCGAVNGEPSELCYFCDAPLGSTRNGASKRVATAAPEDLAPQDSVVDAGWRQELFHKLDDYRAARRGAARGKVQSEFPFQSAAQIAVDDPEIPEQIEPQAAPPSPARKRRIERLEIAVPDRNTLASNANFGLHLAVQDSYPVAPLLERCRAAAIDVGMLLFSYGGMLALFCALGGRLGLNRMDGLVMAATLALFYAQYFALFTVFGGTTPGMMFRHLRVASFDGNTPTSRQMLARSFGYLVSAGTCFLGFLWALWDEDRLCWQDRVSQTYLTRMEGDIGQ
jgi:uncharacterized RDD family membrane protein YckC